MKLMKATLLIDNVSTFLCVSDKYKPIILIFGYSTKFLNFTYVLYTILC